MRYIVKKLLTICILAMIPFAVFAAYDVTVRTGGAFNYVTGKTSNALRNSDALSSVDFSAAGFGFEVGMELDITQDIQLYIDFAMTFPSKVTIGKDVTPADVETNLDNEKKLDPTFKFHSSSTFFNFISAHIGFAHRLNLYLGSWEMNVGGGFGFYRINEGFKMVKNKPQHEEAFNVPRYYADYTTVTVFSIGLYGNVRYNFSSRMSFVCTLMPDFGFFTIARRIDYSSKESPSEDLKVKELTESMGFAFSFGMKATLGVSFTF